MDNHIEKKLLEELARFKQIGYNSDNLQEQTGFVGSSMGSHVERLAKRFNMDMVEQEDIEEPEAEGEIPADVGGDAELGGEEIPADVGAEEEVVTDVEGDVEGEEGGEEIAIDDIETEEPTTDTGATELDVTDLVNKDDEISDELTNQTDILSKNTESLNDLMSKLGDLEGHLTSMDDMVDKISDLENKIESLRPKTPKEKLELRKYDSGPFNNTLSDFFVDKQEVFDKTGKKEYILTPEDIEDYNESDIKQSFQAAPED
jgi:hypothetical protein